MKVPTYIRGGGKKKSKKYRKGNAMMKEEKRKMKVFSLNSSESAAIQFLSNV